MTGKDRTEAGDKVRARVALKHGEKQPPHRHASEAAQDTLDHLRDMRSDLATPTLGPSSERAKQTGNANPIAPGDRKPAPGPAQTAAADIAAGHIAAAETAIENHERAEELIQRDPRHERDQLVYELAVTGQLGKVKPSELDTPDRVGGEPIPAVNDQIADDTKRLLDAKNAGPGEPDSNVNTIRRDFGSVPVGSPGTATSQITREGDRADTGAVRIASEQTRPQAVPTRAPAVASGTADSGPANNLLHDAKSKTLGGAEGAHIASRDAQTRADEAERTASGTVIK